MKMTTLKGGALAGLSAAAVGLLLLAAMGGGILTSQAVEAVVPASVLLDLDTGTPGIQGARVIPFGAPFSVAVVAADVGDVQAFNFEVTYDETKVSAPTVSSGSDLDRNPDANQPVLQSTGRTWVCSPPAPVGDNDASPAVGAAFLSCYSTGVPPGPTFGSAGSVIATIGFTALTTGTSALELRNVNVFKLGGVETGSCNPTTVVAATCTGATITAAVSVGGIAERPDPATLGLESHPTRGIALWPFEIGGAVGLIAFLAFVAEWRRRNRTRPA